MEMSILYLNVDQSAVIGALIAERSYRRDFHGTNEEIAAMYFEAETFKGLTPGKHWIPLQQVFAILLSHEDYSE